MLTCGIPLVPRRGSCHCLRDSSFRFADAIRLTEAIRVSDAGPLSDAIRLSDAPGFHPIRFSDSAFPI